MSRLTEIFQAYDDDVDGALEAFANVDNAEWRKFTESAVRNEYKRRRSAWLRSHTREVKISSKQLSMFGAPGRRMKVRSVLVTKDDDGQRHESHFMHLSGEAGAEVLRSAAERDEGPARTTLVRATQMKKLADELERRSKAECRPVSVAEVLGLEAA